jgi:hypothetical protein
LQAQPKILKKLSEHQIYQSGRKFFQRKCVWYLKKEKEPKIRVWTTRWNLQARPKILKKLLKHQINQSERTFSQKKIYLVPQKCKGAKNSYGGYPTKFADSTQNPRKNSEHQIYQSKWLVP